MSNLRHIQVPNDLIGTENIEPKDLVIYLALKSFDGKDCFPGIRTLVELTGANQRTVRYYDFEKFGQAVAYALRNHDERISTVEDQQKEMYEKILALEKRLNIVTQENHELKEQLDKSSKNQFIL